MRIICALLFFAVVSTAASAQELSERWWQLPQTLDDSSASASFEVDSTWVLVQGTTSGLKGSIERGGPGGELIVIQATLPVAKFNTGNESRDEHMREVMHADRFPEVSLRATVPAHKCSPQQVPDTGQCKIKAQGMLTIRDRSLPITVPLILERKVDYIEAKGSFVLRWADYGVEDPSILIARLNPEARITLLAKLRE